MRRATVFEMFAWVAVITSLAASPPAEPWIARADRDLVKVPTTDPDNPSFRNYDLAVAVYDAGPTGARRASAVRMIRDIAGAYVADADSRQQWHYELTMAAAAMAEVDDDAQATRLLADADGPTTLPSATNYIEGNEVNIARAYTLIRLGRAAEVNDLPDRADYDPTYVGKLTAAGRQDMADELRLVVERSNAGSVQTCLQARVFYLCESGFYPEALAVAEAANNDGQIAGLKYTVAEAAFNAGDLRTFHAAEVDALAWAKSRPGDFRGMGTMLGLMGISADIGDRDMVDQLGAFIETDTAVDAGYEDADRLAQYYVQVGERVKYLIQLNRAIDVLKKLDDDPKTRMDTRRGERADVAAACARAGDRAAVNKLFAAMPVDPTETAQNASLPGLRYRVELQFVRGRHYHDALDMARGDPESSIAGVKLYTARMLAIDGRFDEARQIAKSLDRRLKTQAFYLVAVRQAESGKTDRMAEWIDALPVPADRVVLNLAVANTLSGRPNKCLDRAMNCTRLSY